MHYTFIYSTTSAGSLISQCFIGEGKIQELSQDFQGQIAGQEDFPSLKYYFKFEDFFLTVGTLSSISQVDQATSILSTNIRIS